MRKPLARVNTLQSRTQLPELLNGLGLTGKGAEIGVYEGDFAEVILDGWLGERLVLIDSWCWMPDYLDPLQCSDEEMELKLAWVRRRLGRFEGRYEIVREFSPQASLRFPSWALDFIYLDSNHAYRS